MRRARMFITLLFFAAGTAQAQFNLDLNRLIDTAKSIGQASTEIDEQGEIEIGRDVAARLLGAAPLHPNQALQRYVNEVGRWLASQTERAELPWRFAVLDAPQVNAFATPGGFIFVTGGLVSRMRTEAELAGVLAHEIVHVLRKHHLKAIQKGALANVASNVLALAVQDKNSALRNHLVSFGTELYVRGLDKADELEADRLGVVIATRGGYDPWLAGGAANAAVDQPGRFCRRADVRDAPAADRTARRDRAEHAGATRCLRHPAAACEAVPGDARPDSVVLAEVDELARLGAVQPEGRAR